VSLPVNFALGIRNEEAGGSNPLSSTIFQYYTLTVA